MTSYLVRHDQSGLFTDLAITVGIYPIRIASVTFWSYTGSGVQFVAYRYDSGTASGGTTKNVVALRQGAPAASATARLGNLTFTGTKRIIGATYLPPGATTSASTPPITVYGGSTSQIQFPLTTIIAPGSVFDIWGANHNTVTGCEVFFEELRLTGSY